MVFEHIGQQFSVRHTVDTERCSGCRRCIRACDENVWRWDKEKRCAIPRYIQECVHCYKCEMACLNNCIEIQPIEVIRHDPLEG